MSQTEFAVEPRHSPTCELDRITSGRMSVQNPDSEHGAGMELAGYCFEERIGVGGFGEVWRALGPGGFPKAVKILFGGLSGPQAETELKALNRMRELRHPFLLSVERIEVTAGRILVVMELADRSLEQRFREATSAGQRGIPREELLGYMRDAADALDFMSEQHGLQHLDIKPENILLQGSHAKVGDFGLTKNLGGGAVSLVTGFTPLFAPPELFDGHADRASDQYSLAMVYQLMLTGIPAFNGRTPAQLTSQHLKSPPDLSPLHPSDRAVVARAMSKNPRTRFASCRQFIDELSRRRYSGVSTPPVARAAAAAEVNRGNLLTHLVEPGAVGRSVSRLLPQATALRPLTAGEGTHHVRPAVFIGLGGLGCQTIEVLQSRFHDLYPNTMLPAMQFICIDSDADAVNGIKRRFSEQSEAKQTAWAGMQSVMIPLKSSHEYRKTSGEHLNWLSRRWLFNIPRSGRVEGMRPLGRLAFVDHLDTVREAVRRAISAATRVENVNRMKQETRLPVSGQALDIVLVASTTGGTSSGALIDLARLVRSVAGEVRDREATVAAMLLHGTAVGRQSADMQDANTICFLNELRHFCLSGVNPPELSGRKPSGGEPRPLDTAWLVHFGEELSPLEFRDRVTSVADYLELRTFSPARSSMDAWREEELKAHSEHSELPLRTFGLTRVNESAWAHAQSEASQLSAALLRHWCVQAERRITPEVQAEIGTELTELITSLALSSEAAIGQVARLLRGDRSKRVDDHATDLFTRAAAAQSGGNPAEWIGAFISQDMQITPPPRASMAAVIDDVRMELSASLSRATSRVEQQLRSLLDGRGRIAAAEFALTQVLRSTEQAIEASANQTSSLQQAFGELSDPDSELFLASASNPSALKPFARQYVMLLTCQAVSQCVTLNLRVLRDHLLKFRTEKLASVRARVAVLADTLLAASPAGAPVADQLVEAFEEQQLTTARFRLSGLQHQDPRPSDISALTSDAVNFLLHAVGAAHGRAALPETPVDATSFPANVRPILRNVSGGQRVMVVAPDGMPLDAWVAQLTAEFGPCVSVTTMPRHDISVFCEVEGIEISAVVDSLSHLKPRVCELAQRVHSRQDIQW